MPRKAADKIAAYDEDRAAVFLLESDTTPESKCARIAGLLLAPSPPPDFSPQKIEDERMLGDGWAPRKAVTDLFTQKSRLDVIFDSGQYPAYKQIAEKLFPQDHRGADSTGRNLNRAGDKLVEILSAAPELVSRSGTQKNPIRFVDLCGAPGAFSGHFLASGAKGWGLSLRTAPQVHSSGRVVVSGLLPEQDSLDALLAAGGHTATPIDAFGPTVELNRPNREIAWYSALAKKPGFEIYWGPSGTGNIYDERNLRGLAEQVLGLAEGRGLAEETASVWGKTVWLPPLAVDEFGADIVGADGGFEVAPIAGVHFDNLQELFCARIIYAECLSALQTLRPGGGFVCKLFDTTTDLSASTIYLMMAAFENVYIVKPVRSRSSNSERYLACTSFRGRAECRPILQLMAYQAQHGFKGIPGVEPLSTILTPGATFPLSDLHGVKLPRRVRLSGGDAKFQVSFGSSVTTLMARQTSALQLVLDATATALASCPPAVPVTSAARSAVPVTSKPRAKRVVRVKLLSAEKIDT